jgi:hypothetical protein
VRAAFAHDAVLRLAPGADSRAPGGAITVELCGHWDHEPPCPIAPHHTQAAQVGDDVLLRIIFATEPAKELLVRERINRALQSGQLRGPDGKLSAWQVLSSTASTVKPDESDHAQLLIGN